MCGRSAPLETVEEDEEKGLVAVFNDGDNDNCETTLSNFPTVFARSSIPDRAQPITSDLILKLRYYFCYFACHPGQVLVLPHSSHISEKVYAGDLRRVSNTLHL